jgi:hypothetical protein
MWATSASAANNPQNFTISSWVQTSNNTTTQVLVQHANTAAYGAAPYSRSLYIGTDQKFKFTVYTGSTVIANSSTTVANNTWYNITCVSDGGGTSTSLRVYVNGVQEGTATNASPPVTENVGWKIGGGNSGGFPDSGPNIDNSLRGRISKVRIYNIALTAAQVLQNYNSEKFIFL